MTELMVAMVIVAVMASSAGVFFAKLLTIQEREREEAYIREKLSDICGAYADFLSVGSNMYTNSADNEIIVGYRQETGGVSLETNIADRVAYLKSSIKSAEQSDDSMTTAVDIDIYSKDPVADAGSLVRIMGDDVSQKYSRSIRGDASLIPLIGGMVSCRITPVDSSMTNAALGYLEVSARYKVENEDDEYVVKTATVGRVVRLWNRK